MKINKYDKIIDDVIESRKKVSKEIKDRTFKLKKVKTIVITAVTGAALVGTFIGGYKLGQNNPIPEPDPIVTENPTCNISTAEPEILETWANYAMTKYSNDTTIQKNQDAYNTMYISYFMPLEDSYGEYIANRTEESKLDLRQKAKTLEEELSGKHNGDSYLFSNSPFIHAIIQDNMVLVPYTENIKNGSIEDGIETIQVGNKLYRITKTIENEEEKSLH